MRWPLGTAKVVDVCFACGILIGAGARAMVRRSLKSMNGNGGKWGLQAAWCLIYWESGRCKA